jgi:hydrogenase nickel incorporation protein HypA/HybF
VHEMSLMGGVFEVIERTLSQYEIRRVLQVKLRVGELTNAEPDALQMVFEAFCKDTICEGAELIVERVTVRGRCRDCELEFSVKSMFFLCPRCRNTRIEVIEGEELLIESLEVE